MRDLGRAAVFQALGKLIQVVGVAYAARCLGTVNLGLSGTVIVVAMHLQLVLDLGLDIVAVRHVAARTARLTDLTSALFTLRLSLAFASALIWLGVVLVSPLAGAPQWVWCLGAPYAITLVVNYNWFFQATERMPRLALIQMLASFSMSACYLLAFRPGQAAGSDLAVMVVVNAIVGVVVWGWIKRQTGVRLFRSGCLARAKALVAEARPNWLFSLGYYFMANMSLPLIYVLVKDERQSGLYRSASILVTSLQMFLQYFTLMMIPRIVVWRNFETAQFRRRVLLIAAGICLLGAVACAALWAVREPVYFFIYRAEFLEGAGLLPILLLGKFLATASAMFVWAMFAQQRDWLAVTCCAAPTLLSLALHCAWLPRYGSYGAAVLNCGSEVVLLGLCLWAFWRTTARAKPSA